mmetsp:Transcript_11304/g.20896  ORF Transcript_11304/g.20896 Transcript_11304/m.20896 type:complete len:227 (+) Transcript_11304:166-846(+)
MFQAFEGELEKLFEAIEKAVAGVEEAEKGPKETRNVIEQCRIDLGQADSLVRQMTVEARGDPNPALKSQLASHKERLRAVKGSLDEVQQRTERSELFKSRENGGAANAAGTDGSYVRLTKEAQQDRSRFDYVSQRMERSTEALLDSRRTMAEMEDVAVGISENLDANRAFIIQSHERITATSGLIGGASQILRRMRQNETRRKVMMASLIGFMIFVILLVLYSVAT